MDDVKDMVKVEQKKKSRNIKIKLSNKAQIIIETIIVLLFALLTIIIAQYHEYWFDEAQSFLLARDNSFKEIFHYIKYEGTPPLWVIIIKVFLQLGGTYSTFYLLSVFFSTIGIALFEYNKKIPFYLKLLFPFSYYIFFQYTVTVRSYCLILPALMFMYNSYDKRLSKPWLYVLSLIFFMCISLHTLCTAGMLFLFFVYDIYRDFKLNKKVNKKCLIATIVLFFSLLAVLYVTTPASDCSFAGNTNNELTSIISEAFIKGEGNKFIFYVTRKAIMLKITNFPYKRILVAIKGLTLIMFSLIIFSFMFIYKNETSKLVKLMFLLFPITFILCCINCEVWHIGIIFLLSVAYLIVTNKVEIKFVKIFLIIVLGIQIYWTFSSVNYDIKNNYSGSKEAAEFVKENNLLDYKIYGLDSWANSIQIYFEHNIFENRKSKKAFWLHSDELPYMTQEEILDNIADVFVIRQK